MTTISRSLPRAEQPYLQSAEEVVVALGTDAAAGLSEAEAEARLASYGANALIGEKPPSLLRVVLVQLRDPMNLMLLAVTVVSLAISEIPTALMVASLVLLNLVLGTQQEMKARASVDALSRLQVP